MKVRGGGIASATIKRELRRQSAVEPITGHTKADGKLERHWLKGAQGDAINVILVAVGHNIRLLPAWLRIYCALILTPLSAAAARTSITNGRPGVRLKSQTAKIGFFTTD